MNKKVIIIAVIVLIVAVLTWNIYYAIPKISIGKVDETNKIITVNFGSKSFDLKYIQARKREHQPKISNLYDADFYIEDDVVIIHILRNGVIKSEQIFNLKTGKRLK